MECVTCGDVREICQHPIRLRWLRHLQQMVGNSAHGINYGKRHPTDVHERLISTRSSWLQGYPPVRTPPEHQLPAAALPLVTASMTPSSTTGHSCDHLHRRQCSPGAHQWGSTVWTPHLTMAGAALPVQGDRSRYGDASE
jgi:hypothetical protein